uniref:transposase n=1 Tax=Chlorobaculum thiosulfatiphilum TaxID=115852 RepID=UPI001FE7C700|nr:transposase [Chlorobaculum thiosulfatiphilum]
MTKVKERLRRYFVNVLTWFKHAITNAVSEDLNSKIQIVKGAARGFRCFESSRIMT